MTNKERSSNFSHFYLACRNGDVAFVRKYLSNPENSTPEINRLEESVKSTPLHAACYYGHKEIVQLLLAHGCDRSQINGYGLTPYEEASNEEIRRLFKRPTGRAEMRRFLDESLDDSFNFVQSSDEKSSSNESLASKTALSLRPPRKPSIQTYETTHEKKAEIGFATASIAMCQSKLGRFIADKFHRDSPMSMKTMENKLKDIIDQEVVANKDPESRKATDLLNKYLNNPSDQRIEELLRLYTLETRFYAVLKYNPIPLALPLYMTLQTLKDRYYQGRSYRGAKMNEEEIKTYEQAAQHYGSLLQTKHFSSTSQSREVAEQFAHAAVLNESSPSQEFRALFIFHFPNPCDQAINLSRISETQPSLSEYEDEYEVLILPWTLFQVQSVHRQSPTFYVIELVNILLPPKNFASSLKWMIKHPRGCLKRFQEYFPEKQPENIVRQLMNVYALDKETVLKHD